jgi:hypothetical protein
MDYDMSTTKISSLDPAILLLTYSRRESFSRNKPSNRFCMYCTCNNRNRHTRVQLSKKRCIFLDTFRLKSPRRRRAHWRCRFDLWSCCRLLRLVYCTMLDSLNDLIALLQTTVYDKTEVMPMTSMSAIRLFVTHTYTITHSMTFR